MNDNEKKVFKAIIGAQLGCFMSCYAPDECVLPISSICDMTKLTRYSARKAAKALIAKGLIEYKSQGCPAVVSCGEYDELIDEARPPINGYAITRKGTESEIYKEQYEIWAKSLEEWANDL